MKRTLHIRTITALLVLFTASPAVAGMLMVVTLDEVPSEFQADTGYILDYSIMAHGKIPAELGQTAIRFHGPDGETLIFDGVATSKGRWTAEVTLPEAGEWRWEVMTGTQVLQPLGILSVEPDPAAVTSGLLNLLRIGLPIATLLAVVLMVSQVLSRARIERQPSPATDVG